MGALFTSQPVQVPCEDGEAFWCDPEDTMITISGKRSYFDTWEVISDGYIKDKRESTHKKFKLAVRIGPEHGSFIPTHTSESCYLLFTKQPKDIAKEIQTYLEQIIKTIDETIA